MNSDHVVHRQRQEDSLESLGRSSRKTRGWPGLRFRGGGGRLGVLGLGIDANRLNMSVGARQESRMVSGFWTEQLGGVGSRPHA